MKRISLTIDTLYSQLAKMEKRREIALKTHKEADLKVYKRTYSDLQTVARDLVEILKVESVDLEILRIKDWIPEPPKEAKKK